MDASGARRWTAKGAVRKDDQFTAAPDFIDEHDSDHLPLWGRLEARWHGLSRTRRLVVFASLALLATWGGSSAAFWFDELNNRSGSPGPGSDLMAESDDDPALQVPTPEPPASQGLLNATQTPGLPSPPRLPTPT